MHRVVINVIIVMLTLCYSILTRDIIIYTSLSRIHANIVNRLNIVCTLVVTYMILGRLECDNLNCLSTLLVENVFYVTLIVS